MADFDRGKLLQTWEGISPGISIPKQRDESTSSIFVLYDAGGVAEIVTPAFAGAFGSGWFEDANPSLHGENDDAVDLEARSKIVNSRGSSLCWLSSIRIDRHDGNNLGFQSMASHNVHRIATMSSREELEGCESSKIGSEEEKDAGVI